MYRRNRTKAELLDGNAVYGFIHGLAHPQIAEMIGLAGYDFVMIDGEHGPGGMSAHLGCLQAVAGTPATAILRVAANDTVMIKRALDLGIEGILVPDIRTVEEAQAASASCFYPPRGTRGFSAGTVRASDYCLSIEEYMGDEAAELLVCLMIESGQGVDNVRGIADADGVDVVQVGPFDLTYDLGIPGQFEHPKFLEAMDKVEAEVKSAGKILGGVPLPGLPLEMIIDRGYRFITMGADVPMISEALKKGLPEN
jgi:2-keto-3-deoxy-L-rhamnonate aldolase RhmA